MWAEYKNGNYDVRINLETGTKIRCNDLDSLIPGHAESMDITISTYCENGCKMCYAGCSKEGKHADIMSPSFIDNLEPYTELALNGNEPLHPDLVSFLHKCHGLKLIPSLTVNQHTFMKNLELLEKLSNEKLIYGLGVSLDSPTDEFIEAVRKFPKSVIHVINGIITMDKLQYMAHKGLKILILGYKEIGRGNELYGAQKAQIEQLKSAFYDALPEVVEGEWFDVVSFDNLAIQQLNPKRLMKEDEYKRFFMGDDGSYTFFINMVEKKFAKSSLSTELFDLIDDPKEMFNKIRENH